MRLIDAVHYCENICKCNREHCDKSKCPILNTPTIDAEPVRHGTWEEIETYAFVGFDGNGSLKERRQKYYRHICGRCSAIKEKFCPNCGAKMDGGGSNEG